MAKFDSSNRSPKLKSLPLPALTMAVPVLMFSIVAMSVAFVFSAEANLTEGQTTTLIIGLYGIPGILSLVLTYIYRQPLMVAWSIPGLIFLTSLAGNFTYNEMIAATMVAGAAVALIGACGLSSRLAAVLPAPVVFGMLGGIVLAYVAGIFTQLDGAPMLIGIPVIVFLLGQRFLDRRIPPLLPAIIIGIVVAMISGEMEIPAREWSSPSLGDVRPVFNLPAILTISPAIIVFIAAQGNLITAIYLRHQRYDPPERVLDGATGVATMLVSLAGAGLVTMASLLAPMTAGPDSGEHAQRHWSVYAAGLGFVVIGSFAGVATIWSTVVPISLLLALAGLALIGVLRQALQEVTRGPLVLGPVFAFAIAVSELSLFGLGNVFWALVIGAGVSVLLEDYRGEQDPTSAKRNK